ncbi:MAG: dienelactone hydrolase family protein [Cyanobacteria bacterium J06626_4]
MDIQKLTVEIQSGGVTIPAYLAHPTAAQGLPLIVVIQEVFGVNAHMRDVTERLAGEGYIAITPHIYHRQAPGFEVGYSNADLALGRDYKNGTQASELLQDIKGAIAYGHHHFGCSAATVGCIGFCFGGHVAYLAATLPEIAATASFYGAGISTFTPGGGPPTLSQTPQIQGTVYAFFGLQDPLISSAEIVQLEAALTQAGIDHCIYRYPQASHGFFCDCRDSYDASAAADAWQQVKALFRDLLRPRQSTL